MSLEVKYDPVQDQIDAERIKGKERFVNIFEVFMKFYNSILSEAGKFAPPTGSANRIAAAKLTEVYFNE